MCWNKGKLYWKTAKLLYFCHVKKLVRPKTFGPYYVCLTVMKIKIKGFWDVNTCRLVDRYQQFVRLLRFHLRLRAWRQCDVRNCVPDYTASHPTRQYFKYKPCLSDVLVGYKGLPSLRRRANTLDDGSSTCGHICECVYTIKVTQYWRRSVPVIVIFTRATREPAHNNGFGPLAQNGWKRLPYTYVIRDNDRRK